MALFRELLSRKVDEAANRAPIVSPPTADLVQRSGYMSGIPIGGATEISPGQSAGGDSIDRASFMQQMLQAYLSCQWSSACVDVIARTCTAGGIDAIPISASLESDKVPDMPPAVREVMDLLMFVNPYDDIRQLMRGAITDSLVYGDSFTEVVWLMGKPVSLWPLDPATMTILSDEHGILRGYHQSMPTGREVTFAPHEVIHVKLDSPGGGLYGLSPTQKNILPITSWLFTAALVKETMKRGDPIRAHVDWPLALPPSEMKRFQEQFQVRNLGARNIGNLFETKGGAHVQELGANQVKNWLDVLQQRRDEILSGYGVPPSKVGVIESGNLGGGTGTSQDRMFRVNTCGPIEEALLEKFTFALLYQAYGVTDWRLKFGEVDWRDDKVIEDIRDLRVRNGSWCVDPETEILTSEGWKKHDELVVGEDVLTLNHETGKSEWHPLKEVATFDLVDAPMIEMSARTHSSVTTPNHRWPVKRMHQYRSPTDRNREWTTTETMYAQDQIIVAAPSGDRPFAPSIKDDLVELVAWFWTEGHVPEGAKFCFITQKKQDGRERIERCLHSVFGEPYERSHYRPKDGTANAWIARVRDDGTHTYRIAAPHAEEILQYIDQDGHAPTMDFLFALTEDQLELFVEASLMGDGVNSKLAGKSGIQALGQKRRIAAERFQIACIMAGRTAHMSVRIRNDTDGRPNPHEPHYLVSVGKTQTTQPKRYGGYRELTYTGLVWCPVTTNQTWMARRNDKVFFTGNTIDRYRSDIGEPSIEGGDLPILVDRQNLVLWSDMKNMSQAVVAATQAKATPLDPGTPATPASQATPSDKVNTGSPNQQATAFKNIQKATGLQIESAEMGYAPTLDERWQAFCANNRELLPEDSNAISDSI